MRKITANYIFTLVSKPLKNGIIILDDTDRIIDIIDTKGKLQEIQDLEFYGGIIVPGFVDAFCMLSWSSFTQNNFSDCLDNNFIHNITNKLSELNPDINSTQKGINHLEAFGTKGAADILPQSNYADKKAKSNVLFQNIDFSTLFSELNVFANINLQDTDSPILINRYTSGNCNTNKSEFSSRYCVGTGSLGTHQKLSVFEELKAIQEKNQNINLEDLLKWGCLNPAKYLGLSKELGSLEIGKKPGLNLISGMDFKNQKLSINSLLKVLL
ncbi:amidohydrolase family protein [Marinifilum sp. RC60d5]|uniref:amidohydrolase family protein n=1 Tax=Marinifilum sp. RC60d5 TaxID=3458414 RepID=UPI004036EC27